MCIEYIKIERSICLQACIIINVHHASIQQHCCTHLTRCMLTKNGSQTRQLFHAICVARCERAPIIGRTHTFCVYLLRGLLYRHICMYIYVCRELTYGRLYCLLTLLSGCYVLRYGRTAVSIYNLVSLLQMCVCVYIYADTCFRNVECLRDI